MLLTRDSTHDHSLHFNRALNDNILALIESPLKFKSVGFCTMGAHLELLSDLGLRHQGEKKQLRSRDNWHHKCNVEN